MLILIVLPLMLIFLFFLTVIVATFVIQSEIDYEHRRIIKIDDQKETESLQDNIERRTYSLE